jgi:hypothetical protein
VHIHFTNNAMEKWRRYGAVAGDADGRDLVTAFERSRILEVWEAPGLRRDARMRYYHDPESKCHLVVEPLPSNAVRIVTVIANQSGYTPILPKRKKPLPAVAALPVPTPPERPAFTNIGEEYLYYQQEYSRLLDNVDTPDLSSLQRRELSSELRQIQARLLKIKHAYLCWLRARHGDTQSDMPATNGTPNGKANGTPLVKPFQLLPATEVAVPRSWFTVGVIVAWCLLFLGWVVLLFYRGSL